MESIIKYIAILFIMAGNCTLSVAQKSAYYDAIELRRHTGKMPGTTDYKFNLTDSAQIYNILIRHLDITNESLTIKQIKDKFSNNPFIEPFLPGSGTLSEGEGSSTINKSIFKMSSIGNLDVTNIADGLAKFLVERVKQELSIAFFKRFKSDLDNNEQLKLIFPASFRALRAIDTDIYNYSLYLDLLRESFQKDLAFLIPNIDKLVRDKSMNTFFSECPEVRIMLSDALYIVNEFSEGNFPGEVFHNYVVNKANVDSLQKVNGYIFPSLKTLDLFSQSLRSKQADQYWISLDSLKLLFNDKTTFQIYIGLIYQEALVSPVKFNASTSLTSTLSQYTERVEELAQIYRPYLVGLVENGRSIDYYFKIIKEKQNTGKDKPTYQDYYSLYDASLNFMEYSTQSPFLDNLISHSDKLSNLNNYFSSFRSFGNIYVDIYEKQYTSAIVEFNSIFQTLLSAKIEARIKKNNDSISKIQDKAKQLEFHLTNSNLTKILKSNTLILKYGSIAASIVKAETSDEVKKAIEAVALPAGSSRIKRETPFNVSLNAYPGLFIGHEQITGLSDSHLINSYGLTAPIGVSISTGARKFLGWPAKSDGHWSYSAFVSFVDLGAIAAFRFQNDSVAQVPTIQLKDIFSPGLFISVGIPKCPISVNLGAQVGPNLRSVYIEDKENPGEYINVFQDNVYWRFSASIVVDIPIFNFYTRSK